MSSSHEKKRATMAARLPETTGRDLDAWVALVRSEGPEGFAASVSWLKETHGIGHFQARRIAEEVRDWAKP